MSTRPRPHALYRFYADDGRLLYVGITSSPAHRFEQHAEQKPWWHEVRGISMETYPDRPSVLAAERRAIAVERPVYNIVREPLGPAVAETPGPALTPMPPLLVWVCGVCRKPVHDGEGYLHVDLRKALQVEREWAAEELRDSPIDVNDLHTMPGQVGWLAHHHGCDPDPDHFCYSVDIHTVRTHSDLLRWTAHLMSKAWLPHTDWEQLIERMAAVS